MYKNSSAHKQDRNGDVFARWQQEYAARHIPTFPIDATLNNESRKVPGVTNYQKMGLPASRQLVMKGLDATGIACMAGQRNKLTIIDIDARDAEADRLMAETQRLYGRSRFIVRSGRGGLHAYYRHNGERRKIRPDPGKTIDILGGGVVVLPPSLGATRPYEIIEGHLDDLTALSKINRPVAAEINHQSVRDPPIVSGARNNELFRHCMKHAHHCDDLENLLDVARTRNAEFLPPLNADEVANVAASAWSYTEKGENRFGQSGAWLPQSTVNALVRDPALFALIGWLKSANGPNAEFLVANGLSEPKYLGWPIYQLRQARRRAIETGWIVKVRCEAKGVAALYRWGPAAKTPKSQIGIISE
jgi:Bifunctional DNA primase/polymerase, N-terminal/Primase C terminal 1 (PriCT-1)